MKTTVLTPEERKAYCAARRKRFTPYDDLKQVMLTEASRRGAANRPDRFEQVTVQYHGTIR